MEGAYDETTEHANLMVLNFLHAADSSETRRDEFLTAARHLNEWTLERSPDVSSYLINRWQISVRQGALTQKDRNSIRELKRLATRGEIQGAESIETTCSILLGDIEEIHFSIDNLTRSELEAIHSWPIWTLHQNTNLLQEPAE